MWSLSLIVAFFSTVIAGGGSTSRRAARGGYLWLSFVLLSSLLVLLWLVVLASAHKMPQYDVWTQSFSGHSPYNLWWSELAMVAAQVFTFVGVPLFGLAVYFSRRLRSIMRFPSLPGPAAHRMVEVFLIAGACALFAATIFIVWTWIQPKFFTTESSMLKIYQMSAIRIPAMLVFLLPGIRVIGDIVGDVLFHVQPEGSEVSSRKDTGERLELLLAELERRETRYPVVILAHSQGSIISWELLNREPSFTEVFVSVGSPLTTLYQRFFGGKYPDSYSMALEWHNLYREGDYVGGVVDGCPDNKCIGPGVHTDYWSDVVFAKQFRDCLMNQGQGGVV